MLDKLLGGENLLEAYTDVKEAKKEQKTFGDLIEKFHLLFIVGQLE
ncbi:MAG: hypothetical protein ACJ0QS_07775 [Parvicellaceae bacterium]